MVNAGGPSPDHDTLVGATLGQYEILRRLGRGGMATVYLARQPSIGRMVAIKVLPRALMLDETFMERFRREARTIARLEHLHILPIYDYGEEGGRPFIVTRYLDGGTVEDLLIGGPLPAERVLGIISQVADALDYAHAQGVVHRDIKPSNILLDETGNAYLADFGIARVQESAASLTGEGFIGTPAYMAPEQAEHGAIDAAADIYALGCTLFEMIAGRVPYPAETRLSQIIAHTSRSTPRLDHLSTGIPASVASVVEKAMAKLPADRFQSAGELARALHEAASRTGGWVWLDSPPPPASLPDPGPAFAGDLPPVPGVPASAPAGGASERRRWPLALGVLIGLLLALVAILLAVLGGLRLAALWAGQAETPRPDAAGPPTSEGTPDPAAPSLTGVPVRGAPIYETRFQTGWPDLLTEGTSTGRSAHSDAGYRFEVGGVWAHWAYTAAIQESQFTAEIDAIPVTCPAGEGGYGLLFHYQDDRSFRVAVVTCSSQYRIIERRDGGRTTLASGPLPPGIDAASGSHTITVNAAGDMITLLVDGLLIDQVAVDGLPAGDIGPYVETGPDPLSVDFTRLSLFGPAP